MKFQIILKCQDENFLRNFLRLLNKIFEEKLNMDQKLRELSDSVTSLTNRLTTIHSLAVDLNVSIQITNNLYNAKCSMAETKILIDIQLLQDSMGMFVCKPEVYPMRVVDIGIRHCCLRVVFMYRRQ